ncbi:hypothetical protein [Halorubrum sp. GN11GM_10-3_MGM]|uniref:hypothetical protein n=1 Tax=Halorubrum sp. GN11GM_10-3_MGM TaxID=2518111 RepID=UPI0010F62683|nr:hypothetical protein [Halorubrum sp. GN11GM_10-3_MGM]TKX70958.1 hypothetical protein EXE40_08665 [Halorubrum sp. GN11GM_10-3_MGM]
MSETQEESNLIESSKKELLLEHDDSIVENRERITQAIESVFNQHSLSDKIEPFGERLTWILTDSIDDDDELEDVVNEIINISINYNPDVKRELLAEGISEDLISLFEHISIHHGPELTKQANQRSIGNDWWNSISSTVTSKNGNTVLNFEFTVNLEKKSRISTNPRGSHLVARHVLEQTKTARNVIGEDVYADVDREVLTDIQDTVEDLIQELDEFEEDDLPSDADEEAGVSAESEEL